MNENSHDPEKQKKKKGPQSRKSKRLQNGARRQTKQTQLASRAPTIGQQPAVLPPPWQTAKETPSFGVAIPNRNATPQPPPRPRHRWAALDRQDRPPPDKPARQPTQATRTLIKTHPQRQASKGVGGLGVDHRLKLAHHRPERPEPARPMVHRRRDHQITHDRRRGTALEFFPARPVRQNRIGATTCHQTATIHQAMVHPPGHKSNGGYLRPQTSKRNRFNEQKREEVVDFFFFRSNARFFFCAQKIDPSADGSRRARGLSKACVNSTPPLSHRALHALAWIGGRIDGGHRSRRAVFYFAIIFDQPQKSKRATCLSANTPSHTPRATHRRRRLWKHLQCLT